MGAAPRPDDVPSSPVGPVGPDDEPVLDQTAQRYHSLFAYNPHATFTLDLEGRFTDANDVTQELSGWTLEELREMTYVDLLCEEDVAEAVGVFEAARAQLPQQHQASMRTRDGQVLEISVAAAPVVVEGEVVGVHGVAEDMTEENELRRALEDARHVAEEANAAKSMFLANMSHEVRTPLTSVLAASEMLGEGSLDPTQHHLVGVIHRSGERLLRLVNDILDVSRLEAGKLAVHRAPFTFEAIVADLAAWAGPLSRHEGLGWSWEIDPKLPETVVGDAMRLSQVLTNLVGNALKFTESGEVRLVVEQVDRRPGVVMVRWTVEDTGIGIDPERLASLFESFTQVDASHTRRYGGAGLGLAICRELVLLMGGQMHAESTPGAGSRFSFDLPLGTVGRST